MVVIWAIWSLLVARISSVQGDLPIHALNSDVLGQWKIYETELFKAPQMCGGTAPNSNVENLKLVDYKSYLLESFGKLHEKRIELSDERSFKREMVSPRNEWSFFTVKEADTDKSLGTWTMVYDEGLDIAIGDHKYFGYFDYKRGTSEECRRVIEGSYEDPLGQIPCYKTNPSEIKIGWVSKRTVENGKISHTWGCFYAEKIHKNVLAPSLVLDTTHRPADSQGGRSSKISLWKSKRYPQFEDLTPFRFTQLHKGVEFKHFHHSLHEGSAEQKRRFLQRDSRQSKYACTNKSPERTDESLPRHWSWGDPFNGVLKDIQEYSQGNCGSCYAMSALYVLGRRFEILLKKLYPGKRWNEFDISVQDVISCSPFVQGCYGGFPYLVGRHLTEFGAVSESQFPYEMEKRETLPVCKNDLSVDKGSSDGLYGPEVSIHTHVENRWFANDYGYVGGCYECTTEVEMMKEIYHHGPICVAIDAPSSLFSYSDGGFLLYRNDCTGVYDDANKHGYVCDLPNRNLNGWEYTNHAIAIVGWGEDVTENGVQKYWIVRNTWGKSWGFEGFLKIKRGINLNGIESQAVYIDPDIHRGIGFKLVNQAISREL